VENQKFGGGNTTDPHPSETSGDHDRVRLSSEARPGSFDERFDLADYFSGFTVAQGGADTSKYKPGPSRNLSIPSASPDVGNSVSGKLTARNISETSARMLVTGHPGKPQPPADNAGARATPGISRGDRRSRETGNTKARNRKTEHVELVKPVQHVEPAEKPKSLMGYSISLIPLGVPEH
jgi:hypothetical protein